jgi:hypothetical protein
MCKKFLGMVSCFAVLICFAPVTSQAELVVVSTDEGWEFSTDGMVNLFAVTSSGDERPDNVNNGITLGDGNDSFRLRSGFLPGVLAFNIKAPTINGLDMGARIGFYPNPQNDNTKNSFSTQIDLREIYFTVDGTFGQFLLGKTLSLFQGQNTLNGMTLMGTGVSAISGGGTTLGNIGYGYIYPQYNAQLRYTTPTRYGCKLAVGIYDPSVIASTGIEAGVTKAPRFESEASYTADFSGLSVKTWISGLYQNAEFEETGKEVEANGVAGGVAIGFKGAELVLSGFDGQALGSTLMLDTDSLDPAGDERDSQGYIAQFSYTYNKTKFGVAYGCNEIDETAIEETVRSGGGVAELEEQNMLTFGVYHDLNPHFKLVAEYSQAENTWFGGQSQDVDFVSVGTFFMW